MRQPTLPRHLTSNESEPAKADSAPIRVPIADRSNTLEALHPKPKLKAKASSKSNETKAGAKKAESAALTVPIVAVPIRAVSPATASVRTVSRAEVQAAKAAKAEKAENAAKAQKAAKGKNSTASITPIGAARAKRRAKKKHRLVAKILTGVAATAVLAGATYLLGYSPFFALDADYVRVVAVEDTMIDVEAVAEVALANTGKQLISIRTGEIRAAVAELAAVREVQVQRNWPAGLTVTVEAREPVAAVQAGERYMLVDGEGVALGKARLRGDLPKLVVDLGDQAAIVSALEVYRELPEQVAGQLRHVSAKSRDNVSTTLTTG
ncbi:MAG: FtsQ-type POTRA domain-containing protein, partial [Cellulomonadaceae bacterium]|nr:FtsQ-type POTRA domain-containing protein [Cellulomonadaceae bacterium]